MRILVQTSGIVLPIPLRISDIYSVIIWLYYLISPPFHHLFFSYFVLWYSRLFCSFLFPLSLHKSFLLFHINFLILFWSFFLKMFFLFHFFFTLSHFISFSFIFCFSSLSSGFFFHLKFSSTLPNHQLSQFSLFTQMFVYNKRVQGHQSTNPLASKPPLHKNNWYQTWKQVTANKLSWQTFIFFLSNQVIQNKYIFKFDTFWLKFYFLLKIKRYKHGRLAERIKQIYNYFLHLAMKNSNKFVVWNSEKL